VLPLPPAPPQAYDPITYRGRAGAYAGQIHEVRWGYYKGWPHGQVRRAIVRKRWFQVVIHGAEQTFLLRVQDNGTLGVGHVLLLDRQRGRVVAKSQQAAPLRRLVVGPDAGEGTKAFLREGPADVSLTREEGQRAWTLSLRWDELAADLQLDATSAPTPSIVIGQGRAPLGHRPALTQRAPLLGVQGLLTEAGHPVSLAGAVAEVTYYNAFLPTRAEGLLLSAEGTVQGRPAALVCSAGSLLGDRQEATLFVDGRPHALPRVELFADGRARAAGLSLDFHARASHESDERRMAGLIHHQSRWAAGDLVGTLALPDGELADIRWAALLERHRLTR
jgi:hypothetical protein